jgi:TRAP-type C4-dicarboxylate transport system permease small subunit
MGQPPRTDHAIDVVSHQVNRLAEGATAVCLAAMTLLVGVQIAGRFLFNYSIFWSDELTRFLLIWVAFLGMSAGVRRGAHPGIDSLVRAVPPRAGRLIVSLAVCCSLIFFAVMTWYGSLLAFRTWAQRSPSLGLRMGIPYLAVPAAGALMLLHAIATWLRPPAVGTEGFQNG